MKNTTMTKPPTKPALLDPAHTTLSVRIGRWFEASATGWGIVAVPVVLLCAFAALLLFAR